MRERRAMYSIIAAGRRSFKTERFLKRAAVVSAMNHPGCVVFLAAPTRSQVKDLLWKDINKLLHPDNVLEVNKTDLMIELTNGATIKLVGLESHERTQGQFADYFFITEFQDCKPEAFTETVEPMLNDRNGIGVFEGRPFGKNHFHDFYLRGVNGDKDVRSYHWKSSDILTAEQIERAKSSLALNDYLREYEASFETESGSPYYAYSQLNNTSFTYNRNLPLILTCDFNATEKPMSWVLGQKVLINGQDCEVWFKALSFQFTNTEMMCKILDEYLVKIGYPSQMFAYGDYAGNQHRTNSSVTDWEIIRNFFNRKTRYSEKLRACKSIRDSIGATNARLCDANGVRRQFVVYDECRGLVDDWQKCSWKSNGRELDERDPLRGHACRAVDYYNYYEYDLDSRQGKVHRAI